MCLQKGGINLDGSAKLIYGLWQSATIRENKT
jgi:hypothetical protein